LQVCKDRLLACKESLQACKDSLLACKEGLQVCKDSLFVCKDSLQVCKGSLFACKETLQASKMRLQTGPTGGTGWLKLQTAGKKGQKPEATGKLAGVPVAN